MGPVRDYRQFPLPVGRYRSLHHRYQPDVRSCHQLLCIFAWSLIDGFTRKLVHGLPLGESAILSRLVAQEIKLRLALGETPTSAEYEQRFPEVAVDIPATDQAAQDTGVKSEDDVDTQREMPTMAPESGPDSTPGSDPLDSATLAGPEQQAKRQVILEGDFVPGYDLLG